MTTTARAGNPATTRFLPVLLLAAALLLAGGPASAQQFNSDSYVTMPKGTLTAALMTGQRSSTIITTAALLKDLEVNLGATLYQKNAERDDTEHYSTIGFVKWSFFENAEKTGGGSITAGTGVNPGYAERGGVTNSFTTYYVYGAATFPLFGNTLSLDLNPGAVYNREYGTEKSSAWGFSYSARAAVYKVIPHSAIVGEVYGVEGEAYADPEYKVGVRWESPSIVAALTYSGNFHGSRAAGIELGVMVFTPPFLCFGGC